MFGDCVAVWAKAVASASAAVLGAASSQNTVQCIATGLAGMPIESKLCTHNTARAFRTEACECTMHAVDSLCCKSIAGQHTQSYNRTFQHMLMDSQKRYSQLVYALAAAEAAAFAVLASLTLASA